MNTLPEHNPTLLQAVIFRAKTKLLSLQRRWKNTWTAPIPRHPFSNQLENGTAIAVSTSKLWTNATKEELDLTAGKVHNLRIAARAFDGIEVPSGEVFSFWKQLGKARSSKGYVAGRELREGCIIPTIGGGLCQLSNALYDAALKAGFDIVERHAHTTTIPGSLAEQDRDATVFWNYVDLRFRSEQTFRIETKLSATHLTVEIIGTRHKVTTSLLKPNKKSAAVHNCLTCNRGDCFRNQPTTTQDVRFGQTAFLVDDYWPELDTWMQGQAVPDRLLYVPLNAKRWKKPAYRWNSNGFNTVKYATWATLSSAYGMRKAKTPAERQALRVERDKELAKRFAHQLPYTVKHLVIAQNLLPHLQELGTLGGRTYTVLLTRTPLQALQTRLDQAASKHPESVTLRDFRIEEHIVRNEEEALSAATDFITVHSELAQLFPNKTTLLKWNLPKPSTQKKTSSTTNVLLAGPALGRKGAYLVRTAMRYLDAQLFVAGKAIECDQFWGAKEILPLPSNWKEKIDVVILPAYIEHQPRLLLEALSAGIPVIASKACGLGEVDGVVTLEELSSSHLHEAIAKHLKPLVQSKLNVVSAA